MRAPNQAAKEVGALAGVLTEEAGVLTEEAGLFTGREQEEPTQPGCTSFLRMAADSWS